LNDRKLLKAVVEMKMDKKQQILIRIEKLQQTRDYADEVESARLTKIIEKLQRELDECTTQPA